MNSFFFSKLPSKRFFLLFLRNCHEFFFHSLNLISFCRLKFWKRSWYLRKILFLFYTYSQWEFNEKASRKRNDNSWKSVLKREISCNCLLAGVLFFAQSFDLITVLSLLSTVTVWTVLLEKIITEIIYWGIRFEQSQSVFVSQLCQRMFSTNSKFLMFWNFSYAHINYTKIQRKFKYQLTHELRILFKLCRRI